MKIYIFFVIPLFFISYTVHAEEEIKFITFNCTYDKYSSEYGVKDDFFERNFVLNIKTGEATSTAGGKTLLAKAELEEGLVRFTVNSNVNTSTTIIGRDLYSINSSVTFYKGNIAQSVQYYGNCKKG